MNLVATQSSQQLSVVFMALVQFYNTRKKGSISFLCVSFHREDEDGSGFGGQFSTGGSLALPPVCVFTNHMESYDEKAKESYDEFFPAEVERIINCSESSLDFKMLSDFGLLHLRAAFSATWQCVPMSQVSLAIILCYSCSFLALILDHVLFSLHIPAPPNFFTYPRNYLLSYFLWILP